MPIDPTFDPTPSPIATPATASIATDVPTTADRRPRRHRTKALLMAGLTGLGAVAAFGVHAAPANADVISDAKTATVAGYQVQMGLYDQVRYSNRGIDTYKRVDLDGFSGVALVGRVPSDVKVCVTDRFVLQGTDLASSATAGVSVGADSSGPSVGASGSVTITRTSREIVVTMPTLCGRGAWHHNQVFDDYVFRGRINSVTHESFVSINGRGYTWNAKVSDRDIAYR